MDGQTSGKMITKDIDLEMTVSVRQNILMTTILLAPD